MNKPPIVSYKEILPEVFQDVDKNKIVIKLDDVKNTPELLNLISSSQIIKNKEVYLTDYPFETQNKIIKIFLQNYYFLQFINGDYYFNYSKLQKLFPNNVYLSQIFDNMEPDLIIQKIIEGKNEEFKYYIFEKLNSSIINYIGVLFFIGYYKIENFKEYSVIEYNFLTDINFELNDFGLITDMKTFFLSEFLTFLRTNTGSFFGSNSFGSNVKYLIQTKNLGDVSEKVYLDIKGFINDINVLYGDFIDLIDFKINNSEDYELFIFITISINNEIMGFRVVV